MKFGELAFTPLVKKLQEQHGSRRQYARMEAAESGLARLGDFEQEFLAGRDSFYWATVGATGWPYVQHRGGPPGFLKIIDDRTIALADYRGNKQYISTGNLLSDSRVALIFVDYPRQARLKILGRVEVIEGAERESWLTRVRTPGDESIIERVFVIHIEAFDWNCPQHITPRYTAEELHSMMRQANEHTQAVEQENQLLRKQVADLQARALA